MNVLFCVNMHSDGKGHFLRISNVIYTARCVNDIAVYIVRLKKLTGSARNGNGEVAVLPYKTAEKCHRGILGEIHCFENVECRLTSLNIT